MSNRFFAVFHLATPITFSLQELNLGPLPKDRTERSFQFYVNCMRIVCLRAVRE